MEDEIQASSFGRVRLERLLDNVVCHEGERVAVTTFAKKEDRLESRRLACGSFSQQKGKIGKVPICSRRVDDAGSEVLQCTSAVRFTARVRSENNGERSRLALVIGEAERLWRVERPIVGYRE